MRVKVVPAPLGSVPKVQLSRFMRLVPCNLEGIHYKVMHLHLKLLLAQLPKLVVLMLHFLKGGHQLLAYFLVCVFFLLGFEGYLFLGNMHSLVVYILISFSFSLETGFLLLGGE